MTDQNQALNEDIAYMRALAEQGRDGPMLGGRILFAGGVIFGAASLVLWWLTTRQAMNGSVYPIVWGAAGAAYLAVLIPTVRSLPRTASFRQAAVGSAWSGVGFSISAVVVGVMLLAYRLGDATVALVLPCVLTALYAGGWWIAGALQQKRWMSRVALAAFAAALVNAWYGSRPDVIWLVYGLTLLAVFAVPGLFLMRRAPTADAPRG